MEKQLTLSQKQQERMKALWNPERETDHEFIQRVFDRGLSAMEWQRDSYDKSKDRNKKARKALKLVESDPELSVRAGFATKGDGSTGIQRIS